MQIIKKIVRHTFKILRCAHRKIFKVCLAIYWHPWVVNIIFISINFCLAWWGCLLSTVSFVRRFVQVFCKKRPRWNGKTFFLKTFFFLNNFWKLQLNDIWIFIKFDSKTTCYGSSTVFLFWIFVLISVFEEL